jgi:hypothetical protein
MDTEIRHRFAVLTWAVGISAALTVAMLGTVIELSYRMGTIAGQLAVLIDHVQLR